MGTILVETCLIGFILKYNNYNKYYNYININKDYYKELYLIYKTIPKFFAIYPRDTTIVEFAAFFFDEYPRLKFEERLVYDSIFKQASESTDISEEVFYSSLQNSRQRAAATTVAEKAIKVSEGREKGASLEEAFEVWKAEQTIQNVVPHDKFISDDLDELRSISIGEEGLRWRLSSLNKSLGPLRKGDFGFLFARPETGKTTLLASEITCMAEQTDKPIIWFNNEEQGNKVKLRCFQAALGLTLPQLFSDISGNQAKFLELTGGRIKIYDSGAIFKTEVERIVSSYEPALIVFDQIDKIRGFNADRNDLVMGSIYQWTRELSKELCPVIGVCQADGSGENIKWLTMSHVSEAKTAKQAEADWILGIGKIYEEAFRNVRHFHLSKNKLIGSSEQDPELRHGKWDVLISPEIARYKDLE